MPSRTIRLTTPGSGTWTVPADWDSSNNTIELLAAGGDGAPGGAGGGGGQYAKIVNLALTPGTAIPFHVGLGGGATSNAGGTPSAPQDCDTWFGAPIKVFAQGGGNPNGVLGGQGGQHHPAGPPYPWTWNDGGSAADYTSGTGSGGGGGAGGPNGPGASGSRGNANAGLSFPGGGAGGGANGGAYPVIRSVAQNGDSGGLNRLGAGGGAGGIGSSGGSAGTPGADGVNGGGGGGGGGMGVLGGGGVGSAPGQNGGHGSTDPVWGLGYGPGSGGGGGGADNLSPAVGGVGGDGGLYGGGGGGGGYSPDGSKMGPGGKGGKGLIVITYGPNPTPPPLPPAPTLDDGPRVAVLLRVATDAVIRVWSGQVRDIAIPAGGAETTDGAIYQAMGLLTGLPQLSAALNGDAERVDFSLSGVAVTGEVAAIAAASAPAIRGVAVDVGLILFDADWQLVPPVYWVWSGTADSLTVERGGDSNHPTRTLKLSAANVFSGRRRPNLMFFTDIDQRRRSPDDAFFDHVAQLQQGTTKVWGVT